MRDRIINIIKEKLKNLSEESSTGAGGASFSSGEGAQYASKYSFKKGTNEKGVKNPYYYKLGWKPVPNKIKGSGLEVKKLFEDNKYNEFQQDILADFNKIEELINQLSPAMDNAKDKVISTYNANPDTYDVVISTKMIIDFLEKTLTLLKGEE
jgi:uncharacterized protein (DUF433 family)